MHGVDLGVPVMDFEYTHLQFRRFAGCPVCNMHLRSFASAAEKLKGLGICEIVFFHSSRESLLKHEKDLPFHVVADPQKVMYKKYGVEASPRSVLHPKVVIKGLQGLLSGLPGMRIENGALGLPADILLDSSGRVVKAKYGTHAYDQWSVEELVGIVNENRAPI